MNIETPGYKLAEILYETFTNDSPAAPRWIELSALDRDRWGLVALTAICAVEANDHDYFSETERDMPLETRPL